MMQQPTFPPKPLALIVEDDVDLATVYSWTLESAGCQVHLSFDGFAAQNWLEENVPTIVLMDLNLPYVTGEDLLRHIKQDERFKETHIFVVSAENMIPNFVPDNVDLVLSKPVSHAQLKALSKRYLA